MLRSGNTTVNIDVNIYIKAYLYLKEYIYLFNICVVWGRVPGSTWALAPRPLFEFCVLFFSLPPATLTSHGALRQFITNSVRRRSLGAIYKRGFRVGKAFQNDTGLILLWTLFPRISKSFFFPPVLVFRTERIRTRPLTSDSQVNRRRL